MEAGQKEVLDRLFKGRCRDAKDPLWYHTLRAYWDRDTDECVVKQVAPPLWTCAASPGRLLGHCVSSWPALWAG